jgi:hypothetical protein
MARVKNLDQITGSLKNLSFYTRKGSDQLFVRTKGGASKEKIKRNPEFEALRKNNMEFGGCSKMSKQIRFAAFDLTHVADYNLSPVLSSLAKNIQKADMVNPVGERDIRLSAYREMLTGFSFNRNTRFESLLRIPVQATIDRNKQEAVVNIPAFACSFGLNLPVSRSLSSSRTPSTSGFSLFRISITLGVVTDMQLNVQKTNFEPVHPTLGLGYKTTSTPWYSTQASVPQQQLLLNIHEPSAIFTDNDTLALTVAIEFGNLDAFGNPTPIRGAGAGKILGVR